MNLKTAIVSQLEYNNIFFIVRSVLIIKKHLHINKKLFIFVETTFACLNISAVFFFSPGHNIEL